MTFLISLEQVPADMTVAIGLGIDEGDTLLRLTRLRLADEEPIVYTTSHLPVRAVPTRDPASVRSPTFSLHAYLREHHNGAPTHCRARISPGVATEPAATPLGLAVGTPIFRMPIQTVNHAMGPVKFAIDWIRAARFGVELSRQGGRMHMDQDTARAALMEVGRRRRARRGATGKEVR